MKHFSDDLIVKHLSRVGEYMYRKGLRDAAESTDITPVTELIELDDAKQTLRFLYDEGGVAMQKDFYCDLLCVVSRRIGALAVREALIDHSYPKSVWRGTPMLMNAMYRVGLRDGRGLDQYEANSLFESVGSGDKHKRIGASNISTSKFIDEMKLELSRIESECQSYTGSADAGALRTFISSTIEQKRLREEMEREDYFLNLRDL